MANASRNNMGMGAGLAILQVSTFGQPFEVLKTHMAARRSDNLRTAIRATYARGGLTAFYQGLIPWGWLEAGSKGGILLLVSGASERQIRKVLPGSTVLAGIAGGVAGGLAQTYAVMGVTTTMKTAQITGSRTPKAGGLVSSTTQACREIYRTEGIKGFNKGVNALAMRQMTTWASRMGITRFVEGTVRALKGLGPKDGLGASDKIVSSCLGGALSCWNQPFEVLRIEMQSAIPSKLHASGHRPSVLETTRYIYEKNGLAGFFRGITPRIMLAASVTTFMVAGGDIVKAYLA